MIDKNKINDMIQEAKEIIGDDAIPIIADHLNIHVENNRASCPFHEDDTPSFIWNPRTKYFKCFGCSRVYSILDYLVDVKGSYKEAVNELFKMAHMEYDLYNYKPFDADRIDWFKNYVYPHPEKEPTEEHVIKYLHNRGISKETIEYAGVKEDKYGNVAFEHRDLDGKLLCTKYHVSHKLKDGEKKFWWQKDSSHVPILYNVMKLDYTKPLLIVEGHWDCLACIEAGYTNVCSIPDGANNPQWIEFNYDFLENFDSIILWFDNDEAGKSGIQKTLSRIGEYRCKLVKPTNEDEDNIENYYESYGRHGIRKTDANNILLACGEKRLLDLIERAEDVPVKNLKYLMDCENQDVNDIEKTSTGLKGLDDLLYGNLKGCLTIYTGVAGCVDADTEYFNGTEWKRIADYTEGDKVLEYDINNDTAVLSTPEAYVKIPCDTLYEIGGYKAMKMCLSPEHNVLWYDRANKPHKTQFCDIMEIHKRTINGFTGKFKCSFNYSGNGIDLTDAEIKLMCVVICDGSFYYDNREEDFSHRPSNNTCRFHIKKERKKKKLKEIFNECGIEYREVESANVDYTDFYITAPRHEKEFTSYWYNCNQHQFKVICDNILFWDGYIGGTSDEFSTTNKKTADFIQFAFAACNIRSTIQTYDRRGTYRAGYERKSIEYTVTINKSQYLRFGGTTETKKKSDIVPIKTKDGYKYCFTMPLGTLVLRKNDKIFLSFNSGKSSICNLTSVISPIESGKKVFIFSGELSDGQLLNWIVSPLAGINNTIVWDNNGGRKGFSVTSEAETAIRRYYHDDIILYSDVNQLETNEDSLLQAMEVAYRKYNCEYFLIDNLMSISFDNTSDSIYENQKRYFIKLMNFVNQYQVTVNTIVHPRKGQNGDNKLDIYSLNGSSNLSNLCHRLIAVSRLSEDPEGYSMEIEVIKDRPSQAAGKKCKLMYDYCTRRIYSINDELEHKFSWEEGFSPNYSDNTKRNLICNRPDILNTIPKVVQFNPDEDCDQY